MQKALKTVWSSDWAALQVGVVTLLELTGISVEGRASQTVLEAVRASISALVENIILRQDYLRLLSQSSVLLLCFVMRRTDLKAKVSVV